MSSIDVPGADVLEERGRQDRKWGQQEHHPAVWMVILLEEVGEAAKEILEQNWEKYREELVQVAAVSLSMLDAFDRGEWRRDA
jgi:NTP pyrophosphatase (non-canonical NTP hydrolase)